MPVPRYAQIRPGVPVSIVLKADQRTGRQVQGTVADVLTRGDHPRGIKVRLGDGRIGRVQQLSSGAASGPGSGISQAAHPQRSYQALAQYQQQQRYRMSESHNPWQDEEGQGQRRDYTQGQQQQQQSNNPYSNFVTQDQTTSRQPQYHQEEQQYQAPPNPPPRRHDTMSDLLPQGEERSEQVETMQSYEAVAPQSTDDANQAALQKEFPDIDSSLIAALYGDNKDVGEVRETLQELSRG